MHPCTLWHGSRAWLAVVRLPVVALGWVWEQSVCWVCGTGGPGSRALRRRVGTPTRPFPSFSTQLLAKVGPVEPGGLPVRGVMPGQGRGAGGWPSPPRPGLLLFCPRPTEKNPSVPRSSPGYGAVSAGRNSDRWVRWPQLPSPQRRAPCAEPGPRAGAAGAGEGCGGKARQSSP